MTAEVKEQLDELHRISEDRWARYQQMLPKSDDVSLVVLKGHLIIEEMLYAIAVVHCANPDELTKARLTFAQLLHVVCALTKIPAIEACSPAINLLNKIRNSLVHNLEPKELEPRIYALQKMCEPADGGYPSNYVKPTELPRIAESCICFLIGGLSVIGIVAAMVEKNPQMLVRSDAT